MTMTNEQKHELARRAVDVAWGQDEIGEVERQELRRWLAAAADALRLHGLGAHDRDLVEFLGDERDGAQRFLREAHEALTQAGVPQSPSEAQHLMDSALVRRIRWLAAERDRLREPEAATDDPTEMAAGPERTAAFRQWLIDAMDAVEQNDDCERLAAALDAFDAKSEELAAPLPPCEHVFTTDGGRVLYDTCRLCGERAADPEPGAFMRVTVGEHAGFRGHIQPRQPEDPPGWSRLRSDDGLRATRLFPSRNLEPVTAAG